MAAVAAISVSTSSAVAPSAHSSQRSASAPVCVSSTACEAGARQRQRRGGPRHPAHRTHQPPVTPRPATAFHRRCHQPCLSSSPTRRPRRSSSPDSGDPVVGSLRRFRAWRAPCRAAALPACPAARSQRCWPRGGATSAACSSPAVAALSHQLLNVVQYVLQVRNQLVPRDRSIAFLRTMN